MTTFNYAILTPAKNTVTGTCEATSFDEALARLEGDGAEVLSLVAVVSEESPENFTKTRSRTVDLMNHVIQLMRTQAHHRHTIAALCSIREQVRQGHALNTAFLQEKDRLPTPLVLVAQMGYDEATVQRVLLRVIGQIKQGNQLRKEAFWALGSAAVMLGVVVLLFFTLAYNILPLFYNLFGSDKMPRSGMLRLIVSGMEAYKTSPSFWWCLVGIIILTIALVLRFSPVQNFILAVCRKLPGLGPVIRRLQAAQFMLTSATYLRSGAGLELATQFAQNQANETSGQTALSCEAEYEKILRSHGLLTQADLSRLEAGRTHNKLEMVISSMSSGIAQREESNFIGFLFALLQAGTMVIVVLAVILALLLVVFPLFSLVPLIAQPQ